MDDQSPIITENVKCSSYGEGFARPEFVGIEDPEQSPFKFSDSVEEWPESDGSSSSSSLTHSGSVSSLSESKLICNSKNSLTIYDIANADIQAI